MKIERRIKKIEEQLTLGRRFEVITLEPEETEQESLAKRPDLDPEDPRLDVVFIKTFADAGAIPEEPADKPMNKITMDGYNRYVEEENEEGKAADSTAEVSPGMFGGGEE